MSCQYTVSGNVPKHKQSWQESVQLICGLDWIAFTGSSMTLSLSLMEFTIIFMTFAVEMVFMKIMLKIDEVCF